MTNAPDVAPRGEFEERLLAELQAYRAVRSRGDSRAASPGRRRLMTSAIAAAVVGSAAAIAVPLWVGRNSMPRAYAVERSSDGRVTARIFRFDDASGLEAALAADGVTAVVDYLPAGKTCLPGSYVDARTAVPPDAANIDLTPTDGSVLSVTVSPSELTGYVLVIEAFDGLSRSTSSSDSSPGAGHLAPLVEARGLGAAIALPGATHCRLTDLP